MLITCHDLGLNTSFKLNALRCKYKTTNDDNDNAITTKSNDNHSNDKSVVQAEPLIHSHV